MTFDLFFDEIRLIFRDAQPGSQAQLARKTVNWLTTGSGRRSIKVLSSGDKASIADGAVVQLKFLVSDAAVVGQSAALAIANAQGSTPDGTNFPLAGKSGVLKIVGVPQLEYISPTEGPSQSLLMLGGTGFTSCPSDVRIVLKDSFGYYVEVEPQEAYADRLVVQIPAGAKGQLTVSVKIAGMNNPVASDRLFGINSNTPFGALTAYLGESTELSSAAVPQGVAVDHQTNSSYVTDNFNGTISVLDLSSGKKLSENKLSIGRPVQLAVDEASGQIAVTTSSNQLVIMRRRPDASLEISGAPVVVGQNPLGLAVDAANQRVVVAVADEDVVKVVDLLQRKVIGSIRVGKDPAEVILSTRPNEALVLCLRENSIYPVDIARMQALAPIPVSFRPLSLGLHAESRTLLIGTESGGLILRNLDTREMVGVGRLLDGQSVGRITVHPERGLLGIVDNTRREVATLDINAALSSEAKAEQVLVGKVPLKRLNVVAAAINPATNLGILAHSGSSASPNTESLLENSAWTRVSIPPSLNIPRLMAGSLYRAAIAVSNFSPEQGTLQVTAIKEDGRTAALPQGNPLTRTLKMQAQLAIMDHDGNAFGDEILSIGNYWLKLIMPNPNMRAFFLTGDFKTSMVGAEESGQLMSDMILPAVRPGYQTYYSLINPLPFAIEASVDLIADSGLLIKKVRVAIPRFGVSQGAIDRLFSISDLAQTTTGGYLRVSSTSGLRGYQLIVPEGKSDPAGFNAQSAVTGSPAHFFAHFVAGGGYQTQVAAVNLSDTPQSVKVSLFSDDQTTQTRTWSLNGRGRREVDLGREFNLGSGLLVQGWLKVEGDGKLASYLTYTTSDALAAVVSMPEPRTSLIFSHVAEEGTGYNTGLALLNTQDEAVQVDVKVYRPDGTVVAQNREAIAIPKNGRKVGYLHQLVGEAVKGQSGGYIRVEASRPIHGIEIFSTSDYKAMANVPAQ